MTVLSWGLSVVEQDVVRRLWVLYKLVDAVFEALQVTGSGYIVSTAQRRHNGDVVVIIVSTAPNRVKTRCIYGATRSVQRVFNSSTEVAD